MSSNLMKDLFSVVCNKLHFIKGLIKKTLIRKEKEKQRKKKNPEVVCPIIKSGQNVKLAPTALIASTMCLHHCQKYSTDSIM